jgi:hypothetical protein
VGDGTFRNLPRGRLGGTASFFQGFRTSSGSFTDASQLNPGSGALQSWIVENVNAAMHGDKDVAEHLAHDCAWEGAGQCYAGMAFLRRTRD